MGTNFFWMKLGKKTLPDFGDSDRIKWHIGKRSAAGVWCWDCNERVKSPSVRWAASGDRPERATCSSCGKQLPENMDTLRHGAMAVELGFASPENEPPTGVFTASTFGWCQKRAVVEARIAKGDSASLQIVDEYGCEMTGEAFLAMLRANVPPRLESEIHVGTWFS